jgi:hypothetical protein
MAFIRTLFADGSSEYHYRRQDAADEQSERYRDGDDFEFLSIL